MELVTTLGGPCCLHVGSKRRWFPRSEREGRPAICRVRQPIPFGAFDWSNTGASHDGVMLQYGAKAWYSYGGRFRTSESDLGQGFSAGAFTPNLPVSGSSTPPLNNGNANTDSDLFTFYNRIMSVPEFAIEPYTLLDCIHRQPSLCLTTYPQPQRDTTAISVIQATSVHDYRKTEYGERRATACLRWCRARKLEKLCRITALLDLRVLASSGILLKRIQ